MNDYEAKNYYQKEETATSYERQFRGSLSTASLRARLVGWGEQRAFLRILRNVSDVKTVLDIACGTGRYLEVLVDHGIYAGGIDISDEMLSFAKKRLEEHKNILFIKRGDAEKLPFEDNQFDLITCLRLYHRVPTEIRRRMLLEVKRVGKGKAILFFGMSTPLLKIRHAIRNILIPGRSSNPFPLSLKQLHSELEMVGMQFQASEWVLPFLAEGLVVYTTW
jgi:ubiquinone/menaquinone biosynthesis C-methylase UbiE